MKNFLNYSKNRILFFIFKLAVALFLAYLFSCFMTISPVYASDIVCVDSDSSGYSFYNAELNIVNSDYNIPNAYKDASDRFNSRWDEYVVSLYVPSNQEFQFRFYKSPNFYCTPSECYLSYKPVIHYSYYRSDGESSYHYYQTFDYSNQVSGGSETYISFSASSCVSHSLLFFYSNMNIPVPSDLSNLLVPVPGLSDKFTHTSFTSIAYYGLNNYPEIESDSFKTLNLNTSPYLVLFLKDYDVDAFDTPIYYKGPVCQTPVWNYGQNEKTLNGWTDRCTNYDSFTKINFSISNNDLTNHSVWYFRGYDGQDASIKINTSIWDYKFISDVDNPSISIDGTTYNIIPYDDLTLTADINEKNNVAGGESSNFFDSILSTLNSFFSDFFNKLTTALSDLFVPPDGFMDDYITSMKDSVTNQLGILIYPFTFLEDIINRIVNFHPTNGTIHIPEVQDPFYHVTLIEEQTINLYDIFTSGNLKAAYNIYLYVVDVYLIFGFLNLCYKKFYEFVCSNPGGGD